MNCFNFEKISFFSGFFFRIRNWLTKILNLFPIMPLGFALLRIFSAPPTRFYTDIKARE